MRTRIDYLADKYCFTERNESPRLRQQWQDVLEEECRQANVGPEKSSVLLLIQFYFLMRLQQFCCAIYAAAYCCNRIAC